MTLEELNAIEKSAQGENWRAQAARKAAEELARKRSDPNIIAKLYTNTGRYVYEYHGDKELDRDTLMPIINAALPDLIRIAELQLIATARDHSERAKRLRAQVSAFFTEPTAEKAS